MVYVGNYTEISDGVTHEGDAHGLEVFLRQSRDRSMDLLFSLVKNVLPGIVSQLDLRYNATFIILKNGSPLSKRVQLGPKGRLGYDITPVVFIRPQK